MRSRFESRFRHLLLGAIPKLGVPAKRPSSLLPQTMGATANAVVELADQFHLPFPLLLDY
jgi:hypothetical protein